MLLPDRIPFLDGARVFTLARMDWPRWKPENIVRRRCLTTSCVIFIAFPQPGDNGILNVWGELVGEEDMLTENRISIVVEKIDQGKEFDGEALCERVPICRMKVFKRRRNSLAQCDVWNEFRNEDAAIPEADVVVAWARHS